MTRAYRLTVRIKNNRLWSAILRTFPDAMNQARAAERLGVSPVLLGEFLNLKRRGWINTTGGRVLRCPRWSRLAERIAMALKETPEYLFDPRLYGQPIPPLMIEVDFTRQQLADLGIISTSPSPDEAIEDGQRRERIDAALATLTPREAEVIRRRFGLDGHEETLPEIAATLPRELRSQQSDRLTHQRVAQIEAKALRRLRHHTRRAILVNGHHEPVARRIARPSSPPEAQKSAMLHGEALARMHSVDAVAQVFGVSPWTVRTWLRQGRIPHTKIGRRLLVSEKDVTAVLAANFRPATR